MNKRENMMLNTYKFALILMNRRKNMITEEEEITHLNTKMQWLFLSLVRGFRRILYYNNIIRYRFGVVFRVN